MKKFKLKRIMQYTEEMELLADDWNSAKKLLESDIEFNRVHDDALVDSSIEFCGDVEDQPF